MQTSLEHKHELDFRHIVHDVALYICKDKECKVVVVKSASAHICDWEYLDCKDGYTFYQCKVETCKDIKDEYNDTGCGG